MFKVAGVGEGFREVIVSCNASVYMAVGILLPVDDMYTATCLQGPIIISASLERWVSCYIVYFQLRTNKLSAHKLYYTQV